MRYRGVSVVKAPFVHGEKTAFLLRTIGFDLGKSWLNRRLISALRNPLLIDRVSPFQTRKPSAAVLAKNLVMNIVERKGFSTRRLS